MTYPFTVTIYWFGALVEVKGEASDCVPAKTDCPNDSAREAVGGIEKINDVALVDERGLRIKLPEPLQNELNDRIIEYGEADEAIMETIQREYY